MTNEIPSKMSEVKQEIKDVQKRLNTLLSLQACDWVLEDSRYGFWECSRCGAHTGNLPLYRDSVCLVRKADK